MKNYLATSVPDPKEQESKEREIRRKAEETVKKKLGWKRFLLFFSKFRIYYWVLKHTRYAIRDRENQRFCRSEMYGITRDICRAIGRKWCKSKIIEKEDDIFYLEWNEIWSFIEGTCSTVQLKDLISVRKTEFESYKGKNPPDHIETEGEVYLSKNITDYREKPLSGDEVINGTGCCAGIVEEEVVVLYKPDLDTMLKGQILVAPQTDPGWVVLFPSISGLIVEKGSMLSHSAIVAREMGIPAIVGVKNATRILKTGDRIRLNGADGSIEIIKK